MGLGSARNPCERPGVTMNETTSGVSSYRRFSHWARLACAALLLICQEAGMAVPPIAGPTMPQPVSAAQQLQPAQARIVAPQLQLTRWILRPDAPPPIAPNSEVLIFIHGMDSRAEEADDITKALFKLLPTVPQARVPPVWPPISVTVNSAIVQFTSSEPCDHPDTILNGQHVGVVPFDIVNGVPTPLYFAPMIPPQLLDTPPPTGTQINGPAAHNIGANEGRLRPELRSTAAAADPRQSLRM